MIKNVLLIYFFSLMGLTFVNAQKDSTVIKHKISGSIKNEKGKPVAFASIKMVKEANVSIADSIGNFSFITHPNEEIIVSHIGYESAKINIANKTFITIVLKPTSSSLKEVVVKSNIGSIEIPMETNAANSQIIAQTLQDFVTAQNFNFHPGVIERIGLRSSIDNVHYLSASPSGTFYMGNLVPVFKLQEETKGSKFLLDEWAEGVVVDTANNIIRNDNQRYNYDKIAKTLVLTQDKKTMLEVNKEQLKGFALKTSIGSCVFVKVPLISNTNFLQQLAFKINQYALYKMITTHYEKANYHSDGLTETGKDYNEYVDEPIYFVVYPGGKQFRVIEFKKKSVKDVFFQDSKKVNQYFADHIDQFITESFLIGLVNYLNQ